MNETEERCRATLAREPGNPEALHRLGLIADDKGERQEAYDLLKRAAQAAPPSPDLLSALGRAAARLGKDEEAQSCFARALQADAAEVGALAGLGALFYKQGKLDLALDTLAKAVLLAPERADVRSNLAGVHLRRGAFAEAEAQLRAALIHAPANANLHNSLAVVLIAQRRYAEAEAVLRAVLALASDHTEAQCNLGIVLSQSKRYEEAVAQFRAVLAAQPDHQGALAGIGTAYHSLNQILQARAAFAQVAKRNSRHWWARWSLLVALPILYGDEKEIAEARHGFVTDLISLEQDLSRCVATDHGAMIAAVASRTNFYLHYQGENDRDLQGRYGALITRIAETAFPHFAKPRAPRVRAPSDKIRVGFCSAFLRNHSIAKTHGAWITGLPRERFDVSLFHLGALSDATTERLKQNSRYYDCVRMNQAALAETIAGAELDVLIWLDLGMEAKAQIPSALRLAPVQATTWGHPVTSGLSSIDYFLSSEDMEPTDGETHYTEHLVRLPHLSIAYPRPAAGHGTAPAIVNTLKRSGRELYLCSQSLYKLLPQDDGVFADIAKAVPDADILFVAHPEPAVSEFFRQRMAAAFVRAGADERRVHCVPALTQEDFYALNREVDVILDSFTWSGCNSTLEALAFDRPVVTLPGATMRARHTAAILTRLGMPELIARDRADYVAIAARLGNNPAWRAEVTARIAERSAVLYDDPVPVAALAAWLEQVVRREP
jgi:protein O-GlcNAc transferase